MVLAELSEALLQGWRPHRLDRGGVESSNHVWWRAIRHPKAAPHRNIETRQSHLVDGGNVGRHGEPRFTGHGVGLDRSGADLWQGIGGLIEHQIHMTGNEVLQRGPAAAIGNKGEFEFWSYPGTAGR